jgi:Lon protease-like protein
MQKLGASQECPCEVAGIGVIRASVTNANGTSNLILQGLGRVRLGRRVQGKPYRVHEIEPLTAPLKFSGEMDALVERTLDLVDARLRLGCQVPLEVLHQLAGGAGHVHTSVEQCVRALRGISDPGTMADLITTLLLTEPDERQVILENVDPESRLKSLVRFLTGEIHRARNASTK